MNPIDNSNLGGGIQKPIQFEIRSQDSSEDTWSVELDNKGKGFVVFKNGSKEPVEKRGELYLYREEEYTHDELATAIKWLALYPPKAPVQAEKSKFLEPEEKKSKIEITLGSPQIISGAPMSYNVPGVSILAILIDFSGNELPKLPFIKSTSSRAFCLELSKMVKDNVVAIVSSNLLMTVIAEDAKLLSTISKNYDVYKNKDVDSFALLPKGVSPESLNLSNLERFNKFDLGAVKEVFVSYEDVDLREKYRHFKAQFKENEEGIVPRVSLYIGGHGSVESGTTAGLSDTEYNDFLAYIDRVYERPSGEYPATIVVSSCQPHGHEPANLKSLLIRGGIPGLVVSADASKINMKSFGDTMQLLTGQSTAHEETAAIERSLSFLDMDKPRNAPLIFRSGAKPKKSKEKYLLTISEERRLWLERNLGNRSLTKGQHVVVATKLNEQLRDLGRALKAADKSQIGVLIREIAVSEKSLKAIQGYFSKNLPDSTPGLLQHEIKPPVTQCHLFAPCIRTPLKLSGSPPPVFFSHLEERGYHMFSSIEVPECANLNNFIERSILHREFEGKSFNLGTEQSFFIKHLKLSGGKSFENVLITYDPNTKRCSCFVSKFDKDAIGKTKKDVSVFPLTQNQFLEWCIDGFSKYQSSESAISKATMGQSSNSEGLQFLQDVFFPETPWVIDINNPRKLAMHLERMTEGSPEEALLIETIINRNLFDAELLRLAEKRWSLLVESRFYSTASFQTDIEDGNWNITNSKIYLEKCDDPAKFIMENRALDAAILSENVEMVKLFIQYGGKIVDLPKVVSHLKGSPSVKAKIIMRILAEKQLIRLNAMIHFVNAGLEVRYLTASIESMEREGIKIIPEIFLEALKRPSGDLIRLFARHHLMPDDLLGSEVWKEVHTSIYDAKTGSLRVYGDVFESILSHTQLIDPTELFSALMQNSKVEVEDSYHSNIFPFLLIKNRVAKPLVEPHVAGLYKLSFQGDRFDLYKTLVTENYVQVEDPIREIEIAAKNNCPRILNFNLSLFRNQLMRLPQKERVESAEKLLSLVQKVPSLLAALLESHIDFDFTQLFIAIQKTWGVLSTSEKENLLTSYNRYLNGRVPHDVQIKLTSTEASEFISLALNKDLSNVYLLLLRGGYLGKWFDESKVQVIFNKIYSLAGYTPPWGKETLVSDFLSYLSNTVNAKAYLCSLKFVQQWNFFCKRLNLTPMERISFTTELFIRAEARPELLPFLVKMNQTIDFDKVTNSYKSSSVDVQQKVSQYIKNQKSKNSKEAA
jgi:hypothetical protein